MALPATFVNDDPIDGSWRGGPFIASTGDVYILTSTSLGQVHLEGTTDPTTTNFSSKASYSANGIGLVVALAAIQVGDTIHVATQSAGFAVEYNTFDISTSGSEAAGTKSAVVTVSNPVNGNVAIGVRSDGDIVVAYSGERYFDMGKSYANVTARVSTDGSTWGSDIAISAASHASSQMLDCAAMGASDRFHIFFFDNTGSAVSDLMYVELNSSDTASTPANLDTDLLGSSDPELTLVNSSQGAIAWNDGTNDNMGIAYYANSTDGVNFIYSVDDGTPSWTTATGATDDGAELDPSSSAHLACRRIATAHDSVNDDLYIVYIDATGQDLLYNKSTDGGATWGTDATIQAGTLRGITAAIFTRDGNIRLAAAYDDNGTEEYDEVDLGAAGGAAGGIVTRTMTAARHHALTR